MSKHWIYSWGRQEWEKKTKDSQFGQFRLNYAASSKFRSRGIKQGDTIFVVNVFNGSLYLGGYIRVDKIVDQTLAKQLLGEDRNDLWKAADYALAAQNDVINFRPKTVVPNGLIDELWLIDSKLGQSNPKRAANGGVDPQTFRSIRQLVPGQERKLFELLDC